MATCPLCKSPDAYHNLRGELDCRDCAGRVNTAIYGTPNPPTRLLSLVAEYTAIQDKMGRAMEADPLCDPDPFWTLDDYDLARYREVCKELGVSGDWDPKLNRLMRLSQRLAEAVEQHRLKHQLL